jgi:hypothetical protein
VAATPKAKQADIEAATKIAVRLPTEIHGTRAASAAKRFTGRKTMRAAASSRSKKMGLFTQNRCASSKAV